jgi:predicted RNA-binding Zn ribbon-like protein
MVVVAMPRRPAPSGDFSTHRGEDRSPAPGRLRLVEEFLNTHNHLRGAELLRAPADLRAWLQARGLAVAEPVDPAGLARALELREALRGFLRGDGGSATAIERAWRAAGFALAVDAGARALDLEPGATGVDGPLGTLLAILFEARLSGTLGRLRVCGSEACGWVFYDHSRNASARWCSMEVCGTRSKARRYRARRAARGEPSPASAAPASRGSGRGRR